MHILSQVQLFEGIDDDALSSLYALAIPLKVEQGQYVFKEGSLGHQFYVILTGNIQISIMNRRTNQSPEEIILTTLGSNEIFGEFSIFDESPRSASAIAIESTSLLEFHKADLMDAFESNMQLEILIMRNLGKILCSRLRSTDAMLKDS